MHNFFRENNRELKKLITKLIEQSPDLIGILVFDSFGKEAFHRFDEINIAIIEEAPEELPVIKFYYEIGKTTIYIFKQPSARFIHLFDDESWRNKPNTWFLAAPYLDMIKNSIIIHDPLGKLAKWKKKASTWHWHPQEVEALATRVKSNFETTEAIIGGGDLLEALISFRETITSLILLFLMELQLIPFWDPQKMHNFIVRDIGLHPKIRELFVHINGLESMSKERIVSFLSDLDSYLNQYWGNDERGAPVYFEKAKQEVIRGNFGSSLMCLRFSAYLLSFRVLRKKGIKKHLALSNDIFDANKHIILLRELKQHATDFFELYSKIHEVRHWNIDRISFLFNNTKSISSLIKQK